MKRTCPPDMHNRASSSEPLFSLSPGATWEGTMLLISLVQGWCSKALGGEYRALPLEPAASGHNVAVGMKTRKRKAHRLGFLIGMVLQALRPLVGPPGALFGRPGLGSE